MKRRGSALLIVLGMLSFMVISSVAFAIYMRSGRHPSSYLRRSVISRYLLKSALANAISRIDGKWISANDLGLGMGGGYVEGLYDDPYPGLGKDAPKKKEGEEDTPNYAYLGNRWVHRVFMPFNDASPETTVSTLTLEGLAYLPPAMINEARIYSRRTSTATWCNMTYEAGRYAFCAIDVSDCFDVNRVWVGPRFSSSDRRIGCSVLFPSATGRSRKWSSFDRDAADSFNKIVDGIGGQKPGFFVSLADFNLWAANQGKGDIFSPFAEHCRGGTDLSIIDNSDGWKTAASALYTTDTWFPPETVRAKGNSTETVTAFDLEAVQPFVMDAGNPVTGIKDILMNRVTSGFLDPGKAKNMIRQCLGGVGAVCLYDYLDLDSEPSSLCLPTVETAPMICGLTVKPAANNGQLKPSLTPKTALEGEWDSGHFTVVGDQKTPLKNRITATPYYLDWGVGRLLVSGIAVFPFKRAATKKYNTQFNVAAHLKVFLGEKAMNCRLEINDPTSPLTSPQKIDDYTSTTPALKNGVFAGAVDLSTGAQLDFSSDILLQGDKDDHKPDVAGSPFKKFSGTFTANVPPQLAYWKVVKKEYTKDNLTAPDKETTYYSLDGVLEGDAQPAIYSAEGVNATKEWFDALSKDNTRYAKEVQKPGATWEPKDHPKMASAKDNDPNWASYAVSGAGQKQLNDMELTLHVAAWAVVYSGTDTAVDCVPACCMDDIHLGKKTDALPNDVSEASGGSNQPVLDFRGDDSFRYKDSTDGFQKLNGSGIPLAWNTLYVCDPRFNYAPEAWYAASAGAVASSEDWMTDVNALLGTRDPFGGVYDSDIFMFTSDQGYLQSMGELQFLPYLQDIADATETPGVMGAFLADVKYDKTYQPDKGSMKTCAGFFPGVWHTYSARVPDEQNGKSVFDLGLPIKVESGARAFRVNPFSQDTRVLMAAFANTPFDFYVASTNETANKLTGGLSDEPKDVESALEYAFCSKASSGLGIDWSDDHIAERERVGEDADSSELEDVVDEVSARFATAVSSWDGSPAGVPKWEDVFDGVDEHVGLNWREGKGDDQNTLFGVQMEDNHVLHSVDRKYLHSFWRDCFQNRQQLFLVFLRAEPLTVGGSGTAALATVQLGARGVALVWRDPNPPQEGLSSRPSRMAVNRNTIVAPHRTRILFYHQFE